MYVISIDTTRFESRKRRDWNIQLYNDICVRLNGMQWEYKTLGGVKERIQALQGACSNINIHADSNYMTLKDDSYGTQRVRKGLPGMCTGYVSWDKIVVRLAKEGEVRIPFTSFYDSRAISKSLGLDKCYVVIKKIVAA